MVSLFVEKSFVGSSSCYGLFIFARIPIPSPLDTSLAATT